MFFASNHSAGFAAKISKVYRWSPEYEAISESASDDARETSCSSTAFLQGQVLLIPLDRFSYHSGNQSQFRYNENKNPQIDKLSKAFSAVCDEFAELVLPRQLQPDQDHPESNDLRRRFIAQFAPVVRTKTM